MNKILISEHNPAWANQFLEEAEKIKNAIKPSTVYIDHVGSTSVNGLCGKPIIDILISLCEWGDIDKIVNELRKLGYKVNEKCDDTPRYYLTKYIDESHKYHIHICEPHRQWARDMLIFKNELKVDSEFSIKYANLKKLLASTHKNDIKSYMAGKKEFIENRLREVESEFGVNRLLSCQRSESDKAERLQICMMGHQFLISSLAAISVYFNKNEVLFWFAMFGFILMLSWFFISQNQQRHRSAGDQARRAVLLISGLNAIPSAGQNLRIRDKFNVDIEKGTLRREEDHFATREKPGYKRLVDMIEESSYWTCYLQKASARAMGFLLFIFVILMFLVTGAAITIFDIESLIFISRSMIALMVFIISTDALGLFLSYKNAATSIEEIFTRVESISAKGYPESDALLLMLDYNSAIEKAPTTLPSIYNLVQKRLNKKWGIYSEAKLNSKQTD
ncbi:TPA: GrpB family protein [Enterobacter asburiae]|nr:GrpB family protein [Enterobacter asburiae]